MLVVICVGFLEIIKLRKVLGVEDFPFGNTL